MCIRDRSSIVTGVSRTLSKTITAIKRAVEDDNLQTEEDKDSLNRLLENHFDLEDALRLTDTNQAAARRQYSQAKLSDEEDSAVGSLEKEPTLKKVFTNKTTNALDLPPDGGYGWVCCLCVTLIMFSTWGCNSAFGVFLAFYLSNSSFAGANKYDYALIAGITVFFAQGLPPIVMILMRVFGFKAPMYFGIVLMCAGFVLASYSTKLWQLYLTQGVMSGIAISLIFAPATTVLPGWFLKKRSFAMGLSLVGTGAGGVVYSLAVNKLIENTGNQKKALRILAITCSITSVIATFLLRQRVPMEKTGVTNFKATKQHIKDMFNSRILKKWTVQLIGAWFLFALFGYTLMIFTLSSYAVALGLSHHQGSSLTAIMNGAQSIGRPLIGYTGDKFGRTNVTATLTLLLAIFVFAFWIPAHTYVQLIMFSICIGSCVGVANVMNTVLVADIVGPSDFLPCWGYINLLGAPFMLFAEVIAQALTVAKNSNPYLHTQIFAGCCFTAALILIMGLREVTVKIRLKERQTANNQRIKDEMEEDVQQEDATTLKEREAKYNYMLGPGIKIYFARMFYPMKV